MRNYEGMRLPPAVDPHLRNELLKVDKYLKQLQAVVRNSFGKGNSPGVVVSGGSGGSGGGAGALPDHTHTGAGDGGNTFGEYQGQIKYYGKHVFLDRNTPQVQFGDASTTGNVLVKFYSSPSYAGPPAVQLSWGENGTALSGPSTTTGEISCAGARMVMYKDASSPGIFDAVYGQGSDDNWVMPGPEGITYSIFTGAHPAAPFLRAQWLGNGDYVNYGYIKSKKSLSAAIPSNPGILLEETGAGLNFIKIQAPAIVSADRNQTLMNLAGRIPVVGDDPAPVATNAMNLVDTVGLAAAVGATNLTNSALTGFYMVQYYMVLTTFNAGSSLVTFQVNYTDEWGAQNQVGAAGLTTSVAAGAHAQGTIVLYRQSGEVSYQTNWTTPAGAIHNLRVRITYLG